VNYGSNQAFTITPSVHYHVADVLVDEVSVGPVISYTFNNVTANHTISASFAIDTYTITSSAGAHGTISPLGAVLVNSGSNPIFTITPAADYHVADVLVDGVSMGSLSRYTFTNVVGNHSISAIFDVGSLWYVDSDIAASGDGRSWESAFKTLQQALGAAKAGDEIWVKGAQYKLTAPLMVNKGVAVYGGFAGTETQRDKRNWHTSPTTLDGQGKTQCLQLSADATQVVIDGFVFTQCHGSLGGGVFTSASSTNFANCMFKANHADSDGQGDAFGIFTWHERPGRQSQGGSWSLRRFHSCRYGGL
jgi:hypothetical protein